MPWRSPKFPVTLPTYDEMIGRDGVNDENYNERLMALCRPDRLNVLTIHAEVEGIARRDMFARFVERRSFLRRMASCLWRNSCASTLLQGMGRLRARKSLDAKAGWPVRRDRRSALPIRDRGDSLLRYRLVLEHRHSRIVVGTEFLTRWLESQACMTTRFLAGPTSASEDLLGPVRREISRPATRGGGWPIGRGARKLSTLNTAVTASDRSFMVPHRGAMAATGLTRGMSGWFGQLYSLRWSR